MPALTELPPPPPPVPLAWIFWQSIVRIRAGSSALHSRARISRALSSAERSVNRTTWRPSAGGCWHERMSDRAQRMGTVKRSFIRSAGQSESDESPPLTLTVIFLLRMTSSASSISELLLLTPLLLPPELLCGWIDVSLSDSNPSSLLRLFCCSERFRIPDVVDDVVEEAQDEEEEDMEEVGGGRMRKPLSLSLSFIQPTSGNLLVLAGESEVITSFLTLAKNCEAHWFNCGCVEPGINRCRFRHLT